MDGPKIAVVGAGIVGMTTATLLQQQLRNAKVTILADKFHRDTTSSVAAGIFRPGTSLRGPTDAITKQWVKDSWNYWQEVLKSSESSLAGVMSLSAYIFSKDDELTTRNHLMEDLVPIYRRVRDDELNICSGEWKYGSFFATVLIDSNLHLPWLEAFFKRNGGEIQERKIDSFSSLSSFDLVFNCTGLGAKILCDDHNLVPLRGQVIKVRAPWLKTAFYGDYDTYIIPGFNGIATLGGTRQYDSYNREVCRHDAAAILERCQTLLPRIGQCEILEHRVGLRPHRTPVRVECETKGQRIVHCYGHGGYGVTCAPGTSAFAVKLGIDLLRSNFKCKF